MSTIVNAWPSAIKAARFDLLDNEIESCTPTHAPLDSKSRGRMGAAAAIQIRAEVAVPRRSSPETFRENGTSCAEKAVASDPMAVPSLLWC